ncbi:hypothetical protein OAI07_00240 [Akkermansiaceae bacterium]|nr:hypothetical protein [Akkermansiaceae bacterium]
MGQKSHPFQFVGVIILVLALVLIGLNRLKKSPNESGQDAGKEASSSRSGDNSQLTKPANAPSSAENPHTAVANKKTHRTQRSQNAVTLADKTNKAQRDQLASSQRHLKKILSRDPSGVTIETLADGTELVHLNGTFAHVSGATVDTNGEVHVNCHDNHEGLEQGPQSDEPEQAVK